MYVLPVLTATLPVSVADALWWRHSVLDLATERARTLGLAGATFPWRTIRGQECSSYWPAGTAAFHVNAAVAAAAVRYVQWTGDERFEADCSVPLLTETARMWASLGHHGQDGRFHISGVTGPDEYSAIMDDNVYTNLMAQLNLWEAAAVCERWPELAAKRQVDADEVVAWRAAADAMAVSYDDVQQVHSQALHFTQHQVWDFEASNRNREYPLLLHRPYVELYRKQVVKQADLMLAIHWRGDAFTYDEKCRDFAYYEPLTVRDSSLSACTQSVVAAEVGHLDLAHAYLTEAAQMDLHDLEHNTKDGLHIASLAGTWLAVVAGLGGMRDHGGALTFAPRLPSGLTSLTFSLRFRGNRLTVQTDGRTATYSIRDHTSVVSLDLTHHGEAFTVTSEKPMTFDVPPPDPRTPEPKPPVAGSRSSRLEARPCPARVALLRRGAAVSAQEWPPYGRAASREARVALLRSGGPRARQEWPSYGWAALARGKSGPLTVGRPRARQEWPSYGRAALARGKSGPLTVGRPFARRSGLVRSGGPSREANVALLRRRCGRFPRRSGPLYVAAVDDGRLAPPFIHRPRRSGTTRCTLLA